MLFILIPTVFFVVVISFGILFYVKISNKRFSENAEKSKNIFLRIIKSPFFILSLTLLSVFAIIFSLINLTSASNYDWFNYGYEDYKIDENGTVISNCDIFNGGKIKKYEYGTGGGDDVNYLSYYEINNKKIFLDKIYPSLINDANKDILLESDLNNAKIESFSILKVMQKDNFDIANDEKYQEAINTLKTRVEAMSVGNKKYENEIYPGPERNYKYDSIFEYTPYSNGSMYYKGRWINFNSLESAVYVNPREVSETEYKGLLNCLKKTDHLYLPKILIYKESTTQTDYLNNSFTSLQCKDEDYSIDIGLSGKVTFKIKETDYVNDRLYNFFIGYFDTNGKFHRDIDPYNKFEWEKSFEAKNIEDVGFAEAYKQSATIRLLFDKDGKAINDYIINCVDSKGRNIFSLFN